MNKLSQANKSAAQQAQSELHKVFETVINMYDDPADQRDALLELVPAIARKYGNLDSTAAAEWYEKVRRKWITDDDYTVDSQYDPDDVPMRKTVRRLAGHLWGDETAGVGPDYDAMERGLHASMDRWVKAGGRETIERATRHDPSKPRYARVPQGPTCGFCIMLASRGFVYADEDKAGALGQYHKECDCEIIPSWDKKKPRIDGYDPEALYKRYLSCRGTVEGTLTEERYRKTYLNVFRPKNGDDKPVGFGKWVARQICAEMDTRDRRWLYDGTVPPIDYRKPREDIEHTEPRDIFAIDNLAKNGFRLITRAENAPDGYSNIDLEINGNRWEIKSPNGSSKRAMESNLRKAKKQFQTAYPNPLSTVRVIFNSKYLDLDDDLILEELRRQSSAHGIDVVIQIRKDGSIRRI